VQSLTARAPTRIDFGGGWTDVPPYPEERGGFVCNLAIGRHTTVRLRAHRTRNEERGEGHRESVEVRGDHEADPRLARASAHRAGVTDVAIAISNDFPVGAGLGGSSAAGVALAGAFGEWTGRSLRGAALAEWSRAVEAEDLGIAGGFQDHYAAAFGGALGLRFGAATEVERIPLSAETVSALERRCIVAYTGQSRISGDTIAAVLEGYRGGTPRVVDALARMRAGAESMAGALRRGDVDELAGLVEEQWAHQRALHPGITTERIDAIVARTRAAGSPGVKALGASGGGCVVVVAASGREDEARRALDGLAEVLDFRVDLGGFSVLASEPG
jgi:D-glycero-alpha-D-manno-heptose-7-phosphate kinase